MGAPSVTYGIITHGRRPAKLRRELDSLRALHIPVCEILVAGEAPADLGPDVRILPAVDAARQGRISALRNRVLEAARHELVVFADDDLVFHSDFYEGLCRAASFDALAVRMLNPDGTRYWDWATYGGPRGQCLLAYGEEDPFVYLTSGCCVVRSDLARRGLRWNEDLTYYQEEDVDFSRRLQKMGARIRFNPSSTVTHDDPSYTQDGPLVVRREALEKLAAEAGAAGRHVVARWWEEHIAELWPRGSAGRLALPAIDLRTKLPVRLVGPVYGRGAEAEWARARAKELDKKVWLGVVHHGAEYDDKALQALAPDELDDLLSAGGRALRMQGGMALTMPASHGYRVDDAAGQTAWADGESTDEVAERLLAAESRILLSSGYAHRD